MKLLLSSLLVCFSITLSYSQTKPPGLPGPQAELLNLIKIWNEAELRGDAVKVAQLLAPEFSFVGGSSRKEYLSLMKPDSSLVIESADVDESEIQIYGSVALVTSLNSFKLKKDGRPIEGKFLCLTVWINKGDNWQCVKASLQNTKP
jgi:ketosteroid isomerase-like protein